MSSIEPLTDARLAELDEAHAQICNDSVVVEDHYDCGVLLVESWPAIKERLHLAEEARTTWKKVALERQSIKADYARLWHELRNFLSAFDLYFSLLKPSSQADDAKQAMFSAAIQAREALDRAVTRPGVPPSPSPPARDG